MKSTIIFAATLCATITAASQTSLRVNHIGYLNNDFKAAVYMGDTDPSELAFELTSPDYGVVAIDSVAECRAWEPAKHSARIYFSSATRPGTYTLATKLKSSGTVLDVATVKIGNDVYSRHRLNELPLIYLRQQRCGDNPVHNALCHQHDGYLVLSGENDGTHYDVRGGWHDASDYLQYLPTSANAVYQLLFAYRSNPDIWADEYRADGRPGANGVPDILDEARWGLEWMQRMNPADTLFFNQIADDRDHRYVGVPQADSTDYGFGPGKGRPIYPVSDRPYGLKGNLNRSNGKASSVAKFASAFALGSTVFAKDTAFAADLARRAENAYDYARRHPGASQTAPCVSPYFYEEDNWHDDMELAAAAMHSLTNKKIYLTEAAAHAIAEPVTPWMGADTARHYQWYPFINLGHPELAAGNNEHSAQAVENMRKGIEAVANRGKNNAFRFGIPFIWCSNNLATAFLTQAMLYREITGDETFREFETATRDWLFGVNPWGQTMIILPDGMAASSPRDPHSAMTDITVARRPGIDNLTGGLVDGPVYTTIFSSLWGVHLRNKDRFEALQGPVAVYHDDYSDYSTNEPTMDGTASLTYVLGRLCAPEK